MLMKGSIGRKENTKSMNVQTRRYWVTVCKFEILAKFHLKWLFINTKWKQRCPIIPCLWAKGNQNLSSR